MKRIIVGLIIILALLAGLLYLMPHLWKQSGHKEMVAFTKVLTTWKEGKVTRENGIIKINTKNGRILMQIGKALFMFHENSLANLIHNNLEILEGEVEYWGKGRIRTPNFSCDFEGHGFVSPEIIISADGKACLARRGESFNGKEKQPVIFPNLEVKKSKDGILVRTTPSAIIEISKGPFFSHILIAQGIKGEKKFNLNNGTYHIRACVGKNIIYCSEGIWVEVKNLRKQLKSIDKTPPTLEASITPKGRVVIIRGTTEVGVKVFINGKPVPVDTSGKFFHTLEFDSSGIKTVIIRAIDAAGNEKKIKKDVVVYGD